MSRTSRARRFGVLPAATPGTLPLRRECEAQQQRASPRRTVGRNSCKWSAVHPKRSEPTWWISNTLHTVLTCDLLGPSLRQPDIPSTPLSSYPSNAKLMALVLALIDGAVSRTKCFIKFPQRRKQTLLGILGEEGWQDCAKGQAFAWATAIWSWLDCRNRSCWRSPLGDCFSGHLGPRSHFNPRGRAWSGGAAR